MADDMKLIQAYSHLKALRANLPDAYEIPPRFIQEYAAILRRLGDLSGQDLSDFAIKEYDLYGPEQESYYGYCDSRLLKTRMDAVLGFFDIIWAPQPPKVGFARSGE